MILHSVAWKLKNSNSVVANKDILKKRNRTLEESDFECVSLILSEEDINSLNIEYINLLENN